MAMDSVQNASAGMNLLLKVSMLLTWRGESVESGCWSHTTG